MESGALVGEGGRTRRKKKEGGVCRTDCEVGRLKGKGWGVEVAGGRGEGLDRRKGVREEEGRKRRTS